METKVINILNSETIEIAIELIKNQYKLKNFTYLELANLINKEFNSDISEYDVWLATEPTILDMESDIKLMLKNIE